MPDKKKWDFENLHELHIASNALLRQAILNERYKRWKKVIELYKELLWMIDLDKLPNEYEPPSSYNMLLYELHFHLAVAYQHLDDHKLASKHFSKTIEVVSYSKNGCLAGCLTNSCLMTPIYARRAFANAKLGSYKMSLKDAEKAVVLDSKSPICSSLSSDIPLETSFKDVSNDISHDRIRKECNEIFQKDVYCIRALVRSTFDDELVGLKDLEKALEINPKHMCAIVLKASFTKPLVTDENESYGFFGKFSDSEISSEYEELLAQAVRLCEDSETYLTCNSFHHPCIVEFYDKFLFPLSVPHTITQINLTPEKPSKKQLESTYSKASVHHIRPQSGTLPPPVVPMEAFRCGTPKHNANDRMSWKRRTDYSNAVRKHMARPKSATEFFKQLERHRVQEAVKKRAQSSIYQPGQKFARPVTSPETQVVRPFTAPVLRSDVTSLTNQSTPQSADANKLTTHESRQLKNDNGKEDLLKTNKTKKFEFATPSNYSMPVFQAVNIKCAPRMYYRPWIGDKLPVSERIPIQYSPKFYC